ncbi:uncharacterized protein LOC132302263 [Cornus florida]|uniref:uncharacterized protein LOC132302263 n=1 Tax=Cornus florida TaxID=4283 RepID=UPI00289C6639|nr:uncharacterized protein LOC132302263 [Cornus florida]
MSLNCLTCQSLQRVDSERDCSKNYQQDKSNLSLCWSKVERSWSGNLGTPRPYNKMRNESSGFVGTTKRVKKGHHRVHTSASLQFESSTPRLVRSCGMRRDWSFEDLMQRRDGEV